MPATTTAGPSATSPSTRSARRITHGIAQHVGSVEPGKWADLVLWKPAFFGVKPELVLKGGMIAYAQMGDANASIPTPQPVFARPMFGAFGRAADAAQPDLRLAGGAGRGYRATLRLAAAGGGGEGLPQDRQEGPAAQHATPDIRVDPDTYRVWADGELLTCEPAKVLPMAQRYFPV